MQLETKHLTATLRLYLAMYAPYPLLPCHFQTPSSWHVDCIGIAISITVATGTRTHADAGTELKLPLYL
jgi:hypothetical protein